VKTYPELVGIIEDAWFTLGRERNTWPRYRHKKSGHTYSVQNVVLRESDLVPLVIYRREHYEVHFARPLKEFMTRFKPLED
jgi:hypothetical protein